MSTERRTSWLEIQIEMAPDAADVMSAELAEVADGVELRDAGTVIKAPAGRALAIVHVPPEERDLVIEAVTAVADRLRAAGVSVDPVAIRERLAHEDEWRDVWKQFFRATRVGRRFVVRPSWDLQPVSANDLAIDIDPGRAFGTGGHASTRLVMTLAEDLALRWEAEDPPLSPAAFLDLGCGSGILSIAAHHLWPRALGTAVDLDPDSAACARENLERNRVETITVLSGSLDAVPATASLDLVMANIQADVLAHLAPGFAPRLRHGGHVLLSGLLLRDAEPVCDTFQRFGFTRVCRRDEGEWAALDLLWAPPPQR